MKAYPQYKTIGTLTVKSVAGIRVGHTPWDMKISMRDREAMRKLGLYDDTNNNIFDHEPTQREIQDAAFILERYYGRITAVCIWYHDVLRAWRIVFGN